MELEVVLLDVWFFPSSFQQPLHWFFNLFTLDLLPYFLCEVNQVTAILMLHWEADQQENEWDHVLAHCILAGVYCVQKEREETTKAH